jgi:16S rRNA (guanine1207-N2)-methyltransferase
MHATSELILRNCRLGGVFRPDAWSAEQQASAREAAVGQDSAFQSASDQSLSVLLINPSRDSLALELLESGVSQVEVFTQDFGDQGYFESCGIESEFGLLPGGEIQAGIVILFLPREKDRLQFLLHYLSSKLKAEQQLWLVGENKAGIKSADRHLKKRFTKVKKLDSARHCVLYRATSPSAGSEFVLANYWQDWSAELATGELNLKSLPGCFAHGRLDQGTALLLDYLQSEEASPLKIKGKVMDFGCGAGVIGIFLKQQNPAINLELVDSSASALESCKASLALNGVEAQLTPSDGLEKAHGRYDWMISNPPFHKGIATDLDITRRFIAAAPSMLGNRGRMLLVCNRHLAYEAALSETFSVVQKVKENTQFKVLLAFGRHKNDASKGAKRRKNTRPR